MLCESAVCVLCVLCVSAVWVCCHCHIHTYVNSERKHSNDDNQHQKTTAVILCLEKGEDSWKRRRLKGCLRGNRGGVLCTRKHTHTQREINSAGTNQARQIKKRNVCVWVRVLPLNAITGML